LEVLSALATEHYQQLLDLRATLTLVDARKISDTRYTDHATFNEQLAIADIIVASKADQYGATEFDQLSAYLEQKDWLSERRLEASREGELALRLLDQPRRIWQLPEPVLPSAPTSNVDESSQAEIDFPPEGFIRLSNRGSGFVSHGWIFRSDFVFDRRGLAGLIKDTAAERVKALIRTNKGNVGFNFAGEGVEEVMLRVLPDSRLELIASEDFRLDLFEPKLLATVQTV
jgi:G3E family GTPase